MMDPTTRVSLPLISPEDDPLLVLGAVAQAAVEEDHRDARLPQLLHQQELVSVVAGQAVGVEDVETVEGKGGGLVACGYSSYPPVSCGTIFALTLSKPFYGGNESLKTVP